MKIIIILIASLSSIENFAQREPVTNSNRNNSRVNNNSRIAVVDSMNQRLVSHEEVSVITQEDQVPVIRLTRKALADPDTGKALFIPFLITKKTVPAKPAKLILDVNNPKYEKSFLRLGHVNKLDFEENTAIFLNHTDPLEKTSSTHQGGFLSSTSSKTITGTDNRRYAFFYGFVAAKVNIEPGKRYIASFQVESKNKIDYALYIKKNYTEILLPSSGAEPYLPAPHQKFLFSGNKKISIVIEPGELSGWHYIILAGNFKNDSWKFLRFDMTQIE